MVPERVFSNEGTIAMDGKEENLDYSSNPLEGAGIFNLKEILPFSEPSLLVSAFGDIYSSLWFPLTTRVKQEREDGRGEIMDPYYFLNLLGQDQGSGPCRTVNSE